VDELSRSLKQKAYQGLREYLAISFYLWLIFGLFVLYKSVLLSKQQFSLAAPGVALFNALALGKIMLVARELHFVLCQLQDSDDFCLLDLRDFWPFCANSVTIW
jgi:hypothetical protein